MCDSFFGGFSNACITPLPVTSCRLLERCPRRLLTPHEMEGQGNPFIKGKEAFDGKILIDTLVICDL